MYPPAPPSQQPGMKVSMAKPNGRPNKSEDHSKKDSVEKRQLREALSEKTIRFQTKSQTVATNILNLIKTIFSMVVQLVSSHLL